jgi:hypothetical protein
VNFETVFWFLGFWVVLPAMAYREAGWLGVAGYVFLLAALVAGIRFMFCRIRRVPFWTWE